MFRLYAKFPDMKRYQPVNFNAGHCVGNLIYATLFNEAEGQNALQELRECNPEASFKLVKILELKQ